MEISPHSIRTVEFGTSRKGLDPDQVRTFLVDVADELERAQNQATAMEARARAAVARLQELTDEGARSTPAEAPPVEAPIAEVAASVDESETISRTMLLAQRAADLAVAEAESEAARLRNEAAAEAAAAIELAKVEARTAGEAERQVVESEVNALIARRDFLESDVDHMETFLVDQRTRLRDAATAMIEIAERVPGGLGEVRRPLLSASDDTESLDPTEPLDMSSTLVDEDRSPAAADSGAVDADTADADTGTDETDESDETDETVDASTDDNADVARPTMRLAFDDDR